MKIQNKEEKDVSDTKMSFLDKKSLTNTLESLVCVTQYKQMIPNEVIC